MSIESIFFLLVILMTFLQGKSESASSSHPVVALDIGDEDGLKIYRIHPNCIIYVRADTSRLHLIFTSEGWKILKNYVDNGGCELTTSAQSEELFQGGQNLISEGWIDLKKNESVTLPLYVLEECSIYKGAYLDDDSFQSTYKNVLFGSVF